MGLLERLGLRHRTEAAKYIWGETSDSNKNAPPTFISYLIRNKINNVDDPNHLYEVANKDPLAKYIVYKLAENALDDWFKFVDKDGNEIMLDVQRELTMLDAKKHLTQALAAERWGGHSWLFCGKNRYIPKTREGGRIASLMRFTRLDCVVYEYDEMGNPKTMEITVNVGRGQYTQYEEKIKIPAEDMQLWNTRPIGRGYEGHSALEAVWDMLVYLRELYDSMTWYDRKIGQGLFVITSKVGIPDDLKSNMDTSFQDVSNRRSFVADGALIENMEFIGPAANATDFEAHIDACLKLVAAGTGIPKDVLIGATAGAITGSETNIKSLFVTLNQIQTSIEWNIRDLVRRMGFANEDYGIAWNARYAHDEEEQSKINMNDAQTLAIRSNWLTINELRDVEGLPPIVGGDVLKADFQINVAGMQTAEEREQTRNPTGENL